MTLQDDEPLGEGHWTDEEHAAERDYQRRDYQREKELVEDAQALREIEADDPRFSAYWEVRGLE